MSPKEPVVMTLVFTRRRKEYRDMTAMKINATEENKSPPL
jgi:hypothetical protein